MTGFFDDLAHAIRQIRRQPGFAAVIVLTLGGALGVNTALFSVVNGVWFQPWPVRDPDRVVAIRPWVSASEFQHWTEQSRSFSGLASRRPGVFNLRLDGRQVIFEHVSANYFDVLGIPIVRGQAFSPDDDRGDGAGESAVISHRTWETRLGADPKVVGRSIVIGDVAFKVIGIAAPGFEGAGPGIRRHLWLPFAAWRRLQTNPRQSAAEGRDVQVLGRLAPGVSAAAAEAELSTVSRRFAADRGAAPEPIAVRSTDARSQSPPTAQAQLTFFTLLIAVLFLTLVACANIGNLLLARGHARRGEIAVRLSLGATRARLVRRLLVEASVLALAAGGLGLAVAGVLPRHLFATSPRLTEMLLLDFRPDLRVFLWALVASAIACVVFALAPALRCTKLDVNQVLKDAHGLSVPSLKTSLPSLQALVSVMALGVAGLVLRSEPLVRARGVAASLDGVVLARPEFPKAYDSARRRALLAGVLEGLRGGPGVPSVAFTSGEAIPDATGETGALGVSAGYFEVLGVPIVAGRTFRASDPSDQVVVVNEAFARRFWPGESPLGKRLADSSRADLRGRSIIGVIQDASPSAEMAAYVPASEETLRTILVRGARVGVQRQVDALVAALDRRIHIEVSSGSDWIAGAAPGSALIVRMIGEFGAFTLVLAAMGLFSLFEYSVRQKTREIGIRTALGGRPLHILRTVLRPGTLAFLQGLLCGSAAVLCAGFVMRRFGLPSGVNPLDGLVYAGVGLVLMLVALLAAYRPAHHALRIVPNEALHYE